MRAIHRLFGLALGVVGTFPALAMVNIAPDPGYRYRVHGVASDDKLNVRAQPGADAEVIGSLPPGADDIVVTGSRQQHGTATWWELVFPGVERGSGWVNARFLVRASDEASGEADYPLACLGTEPFWSIAIDGDDAQSSALGEAGKTTFRAGEWALAEGLRGHFVVRLRQKHGEPDPEGFVVATSSHGFCSDGMSDTEYPFSGTFVRPDGKVFGGCCYRAGR